LKNRTNLSFPQIKNDSHNTAIQDNQQQKDKPKRNIFSMFDKIPLINKTENTQAKQEIKLIEKELKAFDSDNSYDFSSNPYLTLPPEPEKPLKEKIFADEIEFNNDYSDMTLPSFEMYQLE
jgi:hypothetical protein